MEIVNGYPCKLCSGQDIEVKKHIKYCCALCPGAVDWYNYGRVLGAWEFGWDCFVNTLLTLCTLLWTIEGPSNVVL